MCVWGGGGGTGRGLDIVETEKLSGLSEKIWKLGSWSSSFTFFFIGIEVQLRLLKVATELYWENVIMQQMSVKDMTLSV